jgi:hypothetical protein
MIISYFKNAPPQVVFTLEIPGAPISKKNNRVGTGRRSHYKKEIKAAMDAMQLIIQAEWAKQVLPPDQRITKAILLLDVYVEKQNSDLDGHGTTVIDALVEAGVLYNDTTAHLADEHFRAWPTTFPAHPRPTTFVELRGELTAKP